MYSKLVIIGPAGSGKNFLMEKMSKKGFIPGIFYTSRPPRINEVEGIDYFFRDESFFDYRKDSFLCIQSFNNWKYGITKDEFEKKDVFIFSPAGLRSLPKSFRDDSFVIYLNPPEETRVKRLNLRNDADSVERRLIADRKDFLNFSDYDIMITNEDF
jgi:guanylate kinase